MVIRVDYDRYTSLQYHAKDLERRVHALESGEEYTRLKRGQQRQRRYYEGKIHALKQELEQSHRQERDNLDRWFEVFQDVQQECEKRLAEAEKARKEMEERALAAERQVERVKEKLKGKIEETVEARAQVEEEKEKNQKLKAQVSQNFSNSSQPSSQDAFRKKVPNNREKTGRKPGGQPGHEGHKRRKLEVNGESIFIPAPPEIENNPDYYRQKGGHAEIRKQVISVRLAVTVKDYWSYVYRSRKTGGRYHPPFPENVRLEVNYDESVRALVFLLKNHINVPEDKIRELMYGLSDGAIRLSRGMIGGINREFSEKTEKEQKEIFARLSSADVLYTDMAGVRLNGELKNIVVCTDGTYVSYAFRDTKGDKAVEGTPVQYCTNVLVHDHDRTYYHYGENHQECNEHHLRYLKGAQENEPGLTWHGKMRSLLQEMNGEREKQPGRILKEEQIADFEKRYDEIVELADREYEDNPPSKYYRKGYNLSVEFWEYRDAILYFLRHPEVDFTNNVSERACRKAKRHQAVSGTFRGKSNQSGSDYSDAMSVIQTARGQGKNIYSLTEEIFRRSRPPKKDSQKTEIQETAAPVSSPL